MRIIVPPIKSQDIKTKLVPQTAQPFGIETPVLSQDGFLGSPLGLRSSTRACIPAWRPNNSGLVSPTKNTDGLLNLLGLSFLFRRRMDFR